MAATRSYAGVWGAVRCGVAPPVAKYWRQPSARKYPNIIFRVLHDKYNSTRLLLFRTFIIFTVGWMMHQRCARIFEILSQASRGSPHVASSFSTDRHPCLATLTRPRVLNKSGAAGCGCWLLHSHKWDTTGQARSQPPLLRYSQTRPTYGHNDRQLAGHKCHLAYSVLG